METIKIRLTFTEECLGTVPKDKEIFKTYIESKKPDTMDDESLTVDQIEASGWTGFHRDDEGLFIYDYMIRGFLKHSGNVQKEIVKIKALRSKIDDFIFVFPRRIHFGKTEPDGVLERPIRVMTMQGPRVSLIRSDFVNAGTHIEFEIRMVKHKEITKDIIIDLLKYGELAGIGQFRNGSYGRFTFEEI